MTGLAYNNLAQEKIWLAGGAKIDGEVAISGAKNAVLPLMAASLLSGGECIINNVPRLDDVLVMLSVFKELGVKADFCGHTLRLDCRRVRPAAVEPKVLGRIRASNLILGPLLARFKEAEIGACGGCSIGSRPLDLHFAALEALGAKILPLEGGYFAFARELKGTRVTFPFPSVGATENLIMAAALAQGQTVLSGAAAEPEIVELAAYINAMGGKVCGAGTPTVVIEGVKSLRSASYTVMPDRIEAGTYLLAGALAGGEVLLRGARRAELAALLAALDAMGVTWRETAAGLVVCGGSRRAIDIVTAPHPGFPTDLQPLLTAALCTARGRSTVRETIFENRFTYAAELKKMGASIQIRDNCAIINGVPALCGADVAAGDLRAGAALVLAALAAEGESLIAGVEYIDRGYEDMVPKLAALGADIRRVKLRARAV